MRWKSIRVFFAENDLLLLQQAIDALHGAQLWPDLGNGARPGPIACTPKVLRELAESAENTRCKMLLLGESRPCVYREAILSDGSGVKYHASMAFNTSAVFVEFGFWRGLDKLLVPTVFSSEGATEVSKALLNEVRVAFRSVAAGSRGISIFLPHASQLIKDGWTASDKR